MFKGKYLKNIPSNFQWQKTPLQVYPLSFLSKHFKLPLPLIQTDYNFIFFIREGYLEKRINNSFYTCEAGSIVFVSVGMLSSLVEVSDNLKGYFVLIEEKIISELFKLQGLLNVFMIDPVLKLKDDEANWIYGLCKLLHEELNIQNPNILTGTNLAHALVNKVIYLSGSHLAVSRAQQIAIQFKRMVHLNFKDHKNITYYANCLSISANYLNRCVKTVFGKSCKELILEVAILHSQIILEDFTKSISQVSFELNFEDPSYFTRLYKSVTGKTPSEYRASVMHNLS